MCVAIKHICYDMKCARAHTQTHSISQGLNLNQDTLLVLNIQRIREHSIFQISHNTLHSFDSIQTFSSTDIEVFLFIYSHEYP